MIIQMTFQMSGGRYDDRSWPPPGVSFEVPDEEGEGLVYCGAAIRMVMPPVPAEPAPEPVSAPVSEAPAEVAPAVAQVPGVVVSVPHPAPGDPKAAWVDYAVSQGASLPDAENQTKAQLQAAYGGRL